MSYLDLNRVSLAEFRLAVYLLMEQAHQLSVDDAQYELDLGITSRACRAHMVARSATTLFIDTVDLSWVTLINSEELRCVDLVFRIGLVHR
jgi:hypothetical protein